MKKFFLPLLIIFIVLFLPSTAPAPVISPGSVEYAKYTILLDSHITSDTITSAQARPMTIIFNDSGGDVDYLMPTATAGLCVYVRAASAHKITLDSAAGDIIVLLDGTALAAGNAIDSDSSNGALIRLIAKDSTYWYVVAQVGAWSDGGAD